MPKWATDNHDSPEVEKENGRKEEEKGSSRKKQASTRTRSTTTVSNRKSTVSKASTRGTVQGTSLPSLRGKRAEGVSTETEQKRTESGLDAQPKRATSNSSKPRRSLSSLAQPVLPPPPVPDSTNARKRTTSTSRRKSTSAPIPSGKPLPFTASTKPIGTRKFKQKSAKAKKDDSSGDDGDGEWDDLGINWQKKPRPPKSEDEMVGTEQEATIAELVNMADDARGQAIEEGAMGRKKHMPTSTPPLTDLRTPAITHLAQVLHGPQSSSEVYPSATRHVEARHSSRRDAQNLPPSESVHKHETAPKEPLFLSKSPTFSASPRLSPSPPPAAQPQTHPGGRLIEVPDPNTPISPIPRPQEPFSLDDSSTDSGDEDAGPLQCILPMPSFITTGPTEYGSRLRSASLPGQQTSYNSFTSSKQPDRGSEDVPSRPAGADKFSILVPNSDTQVTQKQRQEPNHPLPHDSFAPIDNRAQSKSRSSRRQKRTYGKGRTHAFQHGVPLPRHASRDQRLNPPLMPRAQSSTPPPPSHESYRGAERRGSTSVWPDEGVIYGDHVPDSFVVPDHGSPPPRFKKRHRFVRNGPPPEARRKGVIIIQRGESPGSPRWRKRRSQSPCIPVTEAFALAQSQGEVKYERKSHLEEKRIRRRRRRELERRKDQRDRRTGPVLEMQKDNGVQDRMDNWKQNVAETLKWHRRTGTRAHRKLKRIPGWALKPIDTVRYDEYAKKWKQDQQASGQPSKSRSSASRSSKTLIGGRIDELISAGRKARYEHAIRHGHKRSKVRPNPAFLATLQMTKRSPSPDSSDVSDEIDDEGNNRARQDHGGARSTNAARRVLKLSFSKTGNKQKRHSSEMETPQASGRGSSEMGSGTNILGHDFTAGHRPQKKQRNGMPLAFRPPSPPTPSHTPDLPERHSPIELSVSPPENPDLPPPPPCEVPRPQVTTASLDQPAKNVVQQVEDTDPGQQGSTQSVGPQLCNLEAPDADDERPSEVLRSIARLVAPGPQPSTSQQLQPCSAVGKGAASRVASPPVSQQVTVTSEPIPVPEPRFAVMTAPEIDQDRQAVEQTRPTSDKPLEPLPTQFDLDMIGAHINASQLERLDVVLEQEEAERVSKRSSRSRDTSQGPKSTSAPHQMAALQPAHQHDDIQHFPSREPSTHPVSTAVAATNQKNVTVSQPAVQLSATRSSGEKRSSTSSSNARMTGFQFTEHLISKPLPIEVAQDIENTFVAGRSKSKGKSRSERDSARAKRVNEKRKRELRQTHLNFQPTAGSNEDDGPVNANQDDHRPHLFKKSEQGKSSLRPEQSQSGPSRRSATAVNEVSQFKSAHENRPKSIDIGLPKHSAEGLSNRSIHQTVAAGAQSSKLAPVYGSAAAPFRPPTQDVSRPNRFTSRPDSTQAAPPSLVPTELSTQMPPGAQRDPLSTLDTRNIWGKATEVSVEDKTALVEKWTSKSSRAAQVLDVPADGTNTKHPSKRSKSSKQAEGQRTRTEAAETSGYDDVRRSRSSRTHTKHDSGRVRANEGARYHDYGRAREALNTGGAERSKSKRSSTGTERRKRYLAAAEYVGSHEGGF
ncbi:hypothetical protein IAU59_004265 [Kwoniella sp. CBS 9459]